MKQNINEQKQNIDFQLNLNNLNNQKVLISQSNSRDYGTSSQEEHEKIENLEIAKIQTLENSNKSQLKK